MKILRWFEMTVLVVTACSRLAGAMEMPGATTVHHHGCHCLSNSVDTLTSAAAPQQESGSTCWTCHGTGKCILCYGSGRACGKTCNVCSGTGKCAHCHGTGLQ